MMTKTHNASERKWQRINTSKTLNAEPLSCKGRKKGGKRQEKCSGAGDRRDLEDCAVYFLTTLASNLSPNLLEHVGGHATRV